MKRYTVTPLLMGGLESWRETQRLEHLERPRHHTQPAEKCRDTREDDQGSITATISPSRRISPRKTLYEPLAQRTAGHVADASARGQEGEDDGRVYCILLSFYFCDDCRPGRREGSRKDAVRDAEDEKRRQRGGKAPDKENGNSAAHGRQENTGRGVVVINQGAHDHAAKDRSQIEQDDCERGSEVADAEHLTGVGGKINSRQEEAQRLDDVAKLEDEEMSVPEEAQIKPTRAGRLCDGYARLDKVQQGWCGHSEYGRPDPESDPEAVYIDHPL